MIKNFVRELIARTVEKVKQQRREPVYITARQYQNHRNRRAQKFIALRRYLEWKRIQKCAEIRRQMKLIDKDPKEIQARLINLGLIPDVRVIRREARASRQVT